MADDWRAGVEDLLEIEQHEVFGASQLEINVDDINLDDHINLDNIINLDDNGHEHIALHAIATQQQQSRQMVIQSQSEHLHEPVTAPSTEGVIDLKRCVKSYKL